MIGKLTDEQIEEVSKANVLGHLGCYEGFNTCLYTFVVIEEKNGRYENE